MIKEYRLKKGFSQEYLAEKIDISWRHLQRLEHNEANTTVRTLKSFRYFRRRYFNIFKTIKNCHKVISNFGNFLFYPNIPLFFTGGCSFIVFASSINKSLCSFVNFFGV